MSTKFYNGIDLVNQKLVNLADGSSATDAVTKQQLDAAIAGFSWKAPVRVATTAAGTLASSFANGQTIDGQTLATGDRILIKDQAAGAENGIYTVNSSGAPTRATDADSASELNAATVYVRQGTVNADKSFNLTTDSITVGTTALTFVQVGSGGTTYSAGNGLTLASTTFSVNAGTGIIADGTSTRIDPAYSGLAKRYAAAIGDGTSTTITVTHNLGTRDVEVAIYNATTFEKVYADVNYATTNTVTITFATAPTSSQFRAVVLA